MDIAGWRVEDAVDCEGCHSPPSPGGWAHEASRIWEREMLTACLARPQELLTASPSLSCLKSGSEVLFAQKALHHLTEPSAAQRVGHVIMIVSIVQMRKLSSKLT